MDSNETAPILPTPVNSAQSTWQNQEAKPQDLKPIVYQSETMVQLMRVVDKVAPSQANVLILGESGTGKELIARSIHEKSTRKGRPFVAINCGALRENLLESELFGHEKGAFTGAFAKKTGLAEISNGGTLFLDEIGELNHAIQTKLLRFIQEGDFFRVGGKDSIRVDVRLICATNKDLEKAIASGSFREDLFYRINTIVVDVPPLRRRKEDIPLLVQHFLGNGGHAYLKRGREVEASALKALMNYEWPGNIRELQNLCERLQILAEGHTIMLGDLPEYIRQTKSEGSDLVYDPSTSLGDLEKRYILKALTHFDGNKTQAAQALGITIKTLYNKLHEYGEFQRFAVHGLKNGSKTGTEVSSS